MISNDLCRITVISLLDSSRTIRELALMTANKTIHDDILPYPYNFVLDDPEPIIPAIWYKDDSHEQWLKLERHFNNNYRKMHGKPKIRRKQLWKLLNTGH